MSPPITKPEHELSVYERLIQKSLVSLMKLSEEIAANSYVYQQLLLEDVKPGM